MRPVSEVLRLSTEYLAERGVPTPRLDAELLLAHALGLSRVELYTQYDRPLGEAELAACRAAIARRGAREPVAYILGRWGFRRLDLHVDPRVLVPRPETEVLVDRCLALLAGRDAPAVLDVGTGSGAVALAIASEHPDARVTACDDSPDALAVAAENARANGLEVELVESDLLAAFDGRRFDLVASNLPYVPERAPVDPEGERDKPRAAVIGGPTGREVVERLVDAAGGALQPGAWLALEVGEGQAGAIAERLRARGFADVEVDRDLAGIERVVSARWP
jgi:release factor glutamine methyltransferase